jgi:hypothetical protein
MEIWGLFLKERKPKLKILTLIKSKRGFFSKLLRTKLYYEG